MLLKARCAAAFAAGVIACFPCAAKKTRRHVPPRRARSNIASRHFLRFPWTAGAVVGAAKAIVVSKSQKTLTLLERGQAIRTYPIAIGRNASGPKQAAGDWRTPEGLYYVAGHHPASRFHRALRVSYPSAEDARLGLAAGLISSEQASAIRRANEAGVLPPQNTRLGRDIEIHGGYAGSSTGIRGYTRGCIALTNAMIRDIYRWAPDGTPILIQP